MPSTGAYLKRSRHGTNFYFRRRVPDDLQPLVARRHLCRTLDTADLRAAVIRARALAARTDQLFAALRDVNDHQKFQRLLVEHWGAIRADSAKLVKSLSLAPASAALSGGSLSDPPDASKDRPAAVEKVDIPRNQPRPASAPEPGLTFKRAAEQWLREYVSQKAPSTRKEYTRHIHQRVLPFFGPDSPVAELNQRRFAQFASYVRKEHSNLGVNSRKQILATVASFSSWLHAQGLLASVLTTKKLSEGAKRHASRDRLPFTLEQIGLLFQNAARYRAKAPEKFWVTVAAAFLGCRIEELAQIDIERDLRRDESSGAWALSINAEPDADGGLRKSLKNTGSQRIVPVHPALVKHGFIAFLEQRKQLGLTRPFESHWKPFYGASGIGRTEDDDPSESDDSDRADDPMQPKWSHPISKWGGRELNKLAAKHGFDRSKLAYFHSLRHSMSTHLSRCKVPDHFACAYQGHVLENGSMNRTLYGPLNDEFATLAKEMEPALVDYAAMLDALPPVEPPAQLQPRRPCGRPRKL